MSNNPELRGAEGTHPRGYEGFGGVVAPVASQSVPWWPKPTRAAKNAPNVIVILVDDMGFSDIEPFGSEIHTPALNELAEDGYRFTNFRVMPLCAPSRAALLTGANPHRAGFGWVPHLDPGFPGVNFSIPEQMPTLAESFRANGYGTFMVGKWHLTHESKLHDGADKATWPLQRGFDRYFGGMEGMTTLYHPHRIVRDNSPVTEEFGEDEYLTDRLTDEAIGMIEGLRTGGSEKPFFLYFAHHAVHGPVQSKPEDIARFAGKYEAGWDEMRRRRFAKQQADGLWPEDMELPEGSGFDENLPWAELSEAEQTLFARHMEVYAAAISGIDQSTQRLTEHLKLIGEYENTIIVFTSDNGGTGEGGARGTRSYFSQFVHAVNLPNDWVSDVERPLDGLGGPRVFGHYPQGWAHVSNTPYRSYKGNTWEGGVHSPLIVSWPSGLARAEADSGLRERFAYITDLAPTLLELAGAERPERLHGEPTLESDGVSMAEQLRSADLRVDRDQYIALGGQRAYYRGVWKLVIPGILRGAGASSGPPAPPKPQLFDIETDPLEQHDVAAEYPDVVVELSEAWRQDAWHNTVFPILDSPVAFATVPSTQLELQQPVTLRPGMPTLERFRSSRLIDKRSFDIEIVSQSSVADGVLVSHGDQGGGYALWHEAGELTFAYNAYGDIHRCTVSLASDARAITLRFEALPDIKWTVSIEADGVVVGQLAPLPMLLGMAPFTGISAGFDAGPVDWDLYRAKGRFPYSETGLTVRYVPGPKAEYNNEIIQAIDEVGARLMD